VKDLEDHFAFRLIERISEVSVVQGRRPDLSGKVIGREIHENNLSPFLSITQDLCWIIEQQ
jgi:hypothetical protein